MVIKYLPPAALEVTSEGQVVPVEAPPCDASLDIPARHIHLRCDRPKGHSSSHRQFIQLDPPHAVGWCGDFCADPCPVVRGWLDMIRDQGLTVEFNDDEGPCVQFLFGED